MSKKHIFCSFIILLFLGGTLFRLFSLQNLGFEFDTVTTQFAWSKAAVDMGFVRFWFAYTKYLDYLPFSIILGMVFRIISLIFSDSAQSYVFVLKTFNILVDLASVFLVYKIGVSRLALSKIKALTIAGLIFFMPAQWFISSFWGQFDALIVFLVLASLYALTSDFHYKKMKIFNLNINVNMYFLSGLLLAVVICLKPQPVLFYPIFFLYFFQTKNHVKIIDFLSGFAIAFCTIYFVPFVVNPFRTIMIMEIPFNRGLSITRGANTFFVMFKDLNNSSDIVASFGKFKLTVSAVGLLLFTSANLIFFWKYLNIKLSELFTNKFKKSIHVLQNINISFRKLVVMVIIINWTYFMFMMNMHSRYAHFAVIFGLFYLLFLDFNKKLSWVFASIIIVFNLSYTLNQVLVYYWWHSENLPIDFTKLAHFEYTSFLISFVNTCLLVLAIIYFLVENRKEPNQ